MSAAIGGPWKPKAQRTIATSALVLGRVISGFLKVKALNYLGENRFAIAELL
jgi:hypothetical protein